MLKQRIYGFLLRRILGPYLSKSSLEQLHNSIEIAIIEGRFVLKNVELDCDYLTSMLLKKEVDTIYLKKVVAKKLTINLSLRDSNDNDAPSWSSHLTNIYKLGCDSNNNDNDSLITTGRKGVSLNAYIELEGIDVEITPLSPSYRASFEHQKSDSCSKEKTSLKPDIGKKGFVGSYVEAALNSLRLNLEMKQITFRFYNGTSDSSHVEIHSIQRDWLELKIASFSYNDILTKLQSLDNPLGNITRNGVTEVILHKQIAFSGISLIAVFVSSEKLHNNIGNENNRGKREIVIEDPAYETDNQLYNTMGKYEGVGIIKLRVSSHSKANELNSTKKNDKPTHLLHNFEVSFKDSMSIDIDIHNILILSRTIQEFQKTTVNNDENNVELLNSEKYNNHEKKLTQDLSQDDEDKIPSNISDDDYLSEFENELGLLQNIVRNYDGKTIKRNNVMFDSNDANESNESIYETYFDANDQGFSHYQSKLSSLHTPNNDDDGIIHTNLSLVLFKVDLRIFTFQNEAPWTSISNKQEYIEIIIKDFDATSTISPDNTTITSSISSFYIREYYPPRPNVNVNSSYLLYFIEDSIDGKNNLSMLDAGKCLFLHITMSQQKKEKTPEQSTRIHISLQPLEIIYRKSSIDNILNFCEKIKKMKGQDHFESNEEHAKYSDTSSWHLTVKMETVSLIIPIDNYNIIDSCHHICHDIVNKVRPLLKRSNVMTSNHPTISKILDIGCVFEDLSFCLDQNNGGVQIGVSNNVLGITTTFERSLLFVRSPHEGISESDANHCFVNILDIFSFSGETSIDPDALIRMEVVFKNVRNDSEKNQSKKKQSNFPYVTQLHSVKATQQYENEDNDKFTQSSQIEGISFPNSSKRIKKCIRGSDPQAAMSSDARKSDININFHVPSISFDASIDELSAVVQIIMLVSSHQEKNMQPYYSGVQDKSKHIKKYNNTDEGSLNHPFFSISFKCDQICATIHSNLMDSNPRLKGVKDCESVFSFLIVFDRLRMHLLNGPFGIQNVRCFSHDITLYEVENEPDIFEPKKNPSSDVSQGSIIQRSKLLRKRYHRHLNTNSNVIFYRSKLSHPLSPETPSFLLDILINKDDPDDSNERAIHLSIYDMTYRYDVDSCWIEQLLQLVNDCSVLLGQNGKEEYSTSINDCEESDELISVSNLFVTISDCCADFMSPRSFKRACRAMVRVSEVRMSSNLIVPSGLIQTFKMSFADVSLYLSNDRVPYNIENQRLSCSKIVLGQPDLRLPSEYIWKEPWNISIDDALQKMGFVNITSVDWIDAGISISDDKNVSAEHHLITANVSVGQAYLSTCYDSFACLTDMIGEIMLKLFTPSIEQIRTMKENENNPRKEMKNKEFSQDSEFPSTRTGDEISKTLSDALEHDIIDGIKRSVKIQDNEKETIETHNQTDVVINLEVTINDVPDSELSASELRKKYQVNNETKGKDTAILSHIKNYYTVPKNMDRTNNDENILKFPKEFQVPSLSAHGWTTVDHEWSRNPEIPKDNEESAFWYGNSNTGMGYAQETSHLENLNENINYSTEKNQHSMNPRIFPEHIQVTNLSDPLSGGDMNASKFAGTKTAPRVKFRILVKDLSLNCRFYDGVDWEKSYMCNSYEDGIGEIFNDSETTQTLVPLTSKSDKKISALRSFKRRAKIMGSLVDNSLLDGKIKKSFKKFPKSGTSLKSNKRKVGIGRKNNKYFQVALSGLKMRLDSFSESEEHFLSSCMELSISDLFLAETISGDSPVKIVGEWFNEAEHPRDSNDGLLMMKMVSMHPKTKISADDKLMSDESKVTLELLPLRCILHQSAIQYIRKFFSREYECGEEHDNTETVKPAEAFFQQFSVMPCKLKVDYIPLRVDTTALRDGAYVELINLLPLEEMILTLNGLEMENLTGWGSVVGEIACRWIEDICATQLHKFITNSSPFKPFSNVGAGAANMVIIPLEEVKCNGPLVSGIRRGTASFAGAVAFETLTTTAKLTKFAAKKLNSLSIYKRFNSLESYSSAQPTTPRDMNAAARPAIESLSRGLKEANAKFVIIPYREYQRTGTSGAVRSVLKGLPVAICAPLSGASEALSYTLIGFRNQLYPSVYKEEEAHLRGLSTGLL